MRFSRSSSEGRLKELKIFRWVLLGAAIAAVGMHLSSVPLIVRIANNLMGDLNLEATEEPIEVFVVEEAVPEPETPVMPPPPTEAATENEPAASAPEESAPPLRTAESVMPTPPTADSIETVPTESAIATETGVEGGEGAAGEAETIGLVGGEGSTEGDPTEPVGPPNVQQAPEPPPVVERQPVQEVARARPPAARRVACNPCSAPDYPLSERRENIQGQPVINVIFDENGNVVEAMLERSSGNAAFDQAALAEVRANWRFDDPYGLGGQVSVEVTFVIAGSEQFEAAQTAGEREAVTLPVQQSIAPIDPAATGGTPSPTPDTEATSEPSPTEASDSEAESEAESDATSDEMPPDSSQPLEDAVPGVPTDEGLSNPEEAEEAETDSAPTPAEAEENPASSNGEADGENPAPVENRESAPAEPVPRNDVEATEPLTLPARPEPQLVPEPVQPVPTPEPSVEPPPEPASDESQL